MSKSMKPAVKPTAKESQETQIMRAIAMKREAFFQLILGNLLQNPNVVHETMVSVSIPDGGERRQINIIDIVDAAMDGADYAIKKMFNIKPDNSDGNK